MWYNKYIGIKYVDKGRDYDGLDCWGLARLIYKEEFDIELPSYSDLYSSNDYTEIAKAISAHKDEGWEKTDSPDVGNLILFRVLGHDMHVGVYVGDEKFIHALDGYSVALGSLNSVAWRSRVLGFYKYSKGANIARLTVLPSALQTKRITVPVAAGTTLGKLVEYVKKEYISSDNQSIADRTVVMVNSRVITPDMYDLVLNDGDIVEYRMTPGKSVLKFVLIIAIAWVAITYAPVLAQSMGFAGNKLAIGIISAGINVIGGLLVNAIFPVRPPEAPADPGQANRQLLMTGSSNQANKYGSIPVVLGKVRMTPPLASTSFVESSDENSYLNLMLCWGFGPLQITDMRIGANSIDQYENGIGVPVQYETLDEDIALDSYSNEEAFNKLYANDLKQVYLGTKLVNNAQDGAPWTEATILEPNVNRLAITVHFPQGLRHIVVKGDAAGNIYAKECLLELQYRCLDAGGTPLEEWKDSGAYVTGQRNIKLAAANTVTVTTGNYWWSSRQETIQGYRWTRIFMRTDGSLGAKFGAITQAPYEEPTSALITAQKQNTYAYGTPSSYVRLPALRSNEISIVDICVFGSNFYTSSTAARRTDYSYTGFSLEPVPIWLFILSYIYFSNPVATETSPGVVGYRDDGNYVTNYAIYPMRLNAGTITKNSTLISLGVNNYVKRKDAFSHTINIYPKDLTGNGTGTYQVRVRRYNSDVSEPDDTNRYMHDVIFQTLTGYTARTPIIEPPGIKLARTAMRVKATDQINGQIEGINALVQTICLSWDKNSQQWVNAITNNPADLFRYVLQHPGNAFRITNDQVPYKIDLATLQDWSEYCTSYGFTYNAIVDGQKSVLDVLKDIAAAGRASPSMVDGKWTVVIDRPRTDVVQHFTPHNSWGFESTKKLTKMPDGLKVVINNEARGYQEEEIIVYSPGKNASNSSVFETIALPGTTTVSQAQMHARWHLAQAKLRPEIYTINTDLEYIVCNRGDRVKVVHDVPMWGISSGRIKNRLSSTMFEVDEPVPLDSNTSYLVRVRAANGIGKESNIKRLFTITSSSRAANKVTVTIGEHPFAVGEHVYIGVTSGPSISSVNSEITAVTATTITYAAIGTSFAATPTTGTVHRLDGYYTKFCTEQTFSVAEASPEDLFLVGTSEQQFNDLVVLGVEPFGQGNAKITLTDYSPEIYDINYLQNNFYIPAFDTNITQPPQILEQTVTQKPILVGIVSDETVMQMISPGVFKYNMKVSYRNANNMPSKVRLIECQIDQVSDESEDFSIRQIVPISQGSFNFEDVLELEEYKIRLRYIGDDGRVGPWTTETSHVVIGKTNPPASVTGVAFTIVPSSGSTSVTWASNGELDLGGYEIRETDSGWGTAGYLFRGIATNWSVLVPETEKTFYIKAYDTGRRYSTVATPILVTKALPEAVTTVSAEFSGNTSSTTGSTVTFSWPTAVSLAVSVKYYAVTLTKPGMTTIHTHVYGNSWTTNADWVGTATLSVTTYDMLERASASSYVFNVDKLLPVAPTTATFAPAGSVLEIDWPDSVKTTLPIAGYEIRKNNANWGTKDANWVWKGNTSKATVQVTSGTNTWYINAYDTDGRYASTGRLVQFTVVAPQQPTGLAFSYVSAISGSTMTLNWTGVKGTFDIDHYIISLDKPNGYTDITANVAANTWTTQADWLGTCTATVTPVDRAGIQGTSATLLIEKNKPLPVTDAVVSIIGTSLYVNWGNVPRSGGGMPVAGYEIRTTSTGFGTAGAIWRGAVSEATLTNFVTGVNTWYIATYDTDGKYSDATAFSYTVRVPDPVTSLVGTFADTNSTGAQFTASWTPPASVYFAIDYYEVTLTRPDSSVYKVNIKTDSINVPVDWTGAANLSVITVDITGRRSNIATYSLTKTPPASPTTYTIKATSGGLILLEWNKSVASSLPIEGYELRSHGTIPGTNDAYWRGNALSASIGGATIGVNEWDLYAYDTDLGYSTVPLHIHYTVVEPPTPAAVNGGYVFATGATGSTVRLQWTQGAAASGTNIVQFPTKHYEVSVSYTQPAANTITAIRDTTDWELNTLWDGTARVTVRAIDILGNVSGDLTYNVSKLTPNAPSSITQSIASGGVFLDWPDTPKTSLPVVGYEIRSNDADWGTAGFEWKGTASQYMMGLTDKVSNADTFPKTITFYLKSYDSSGAYSSTASPINIIVNRPAATVINDPDFADTSLTSATVTFTWSAVLPVFGLKEYRVVFGSREVKVNATSVNLPADWVGDQTVYIYTVDNLGIESVAATKVATKLLPNSPTNFRAQVIDNNVLLSWSLPPRTTLPVSHVLLKKGEDWATAEVIGNKDGTFTSISELTGGTYRYWIATVDTDDNLSAPVSIVSQVSQPPDFVFNAEYTVTFAGTLNNAKLTQDGKSLVLPVDLTETFEQHFSTRSWAGPSSQVSAGYPIYIQPGVSSGYYEETFDYGTTLGSSQITMSLNGQVVAGNPLVVPTISTSIDGVNYLDYSGTLSIFATNFRYVKIRVTATQLVSGDMYQINGITVRLDAKQLTDSGQVSVGVSGTVANFNKEIIDVTAITVSAMSSLPRTPVYDFKDEVKDGTYSVTSNIATINYTNHQFVFGQKIRLFFTSGSAPSGVYTITSVPNANQFLVSITTPNTSGNVSMYPNSMVIYLFDNTGAPQSGTVSWNLRGY